MNEGSNKNDPLPVKGRQGHGRRESQHTDTALGLPRQERGFAVYSRSHPKEAEGRAAFRRYEHVSE